MDRRADRTGIRRQRRARACHPAAADRRRARPVGWPRPGSSSSRAPRCSDISSWSSSGLPCSGSTCRDGSPRPSRCRSMAALSWRRSGAAPWRPSRKGSGKRPRARACNGYHELRLVVLPQALTIAIPPTVGFLVQLIKNTSLASVIGLVELSREAQLVNGATFAPFAVYLCTSLLYFALCFPLDVAQPAARKARRPWPLSVA